MFNEDEIYLSSDDEHNGCEGMPVISQVLSLAPAYTSTTFSGPIIRSYRSVAPEKDEGVIILDDDDDDGCGKKEDNHILNANIKRNGNITREANSKFSGSSMISNATKRRVELIAVENCTPPPNTTQPSPACAGRDSMDKFISLCKKYDSSNDMKRIIENKVEKHYKNADKKYTSSRHFEALLMRLCTALERSPKECYVYIKELVDELKIRKAHSGTSAPPAKKRKTNDSSTNAVEDEPSTSAVEDGPETYEDRRRIKKISALSKTLTKLHKTIKKLETKEVDWEDDNDSHYIMMQRYKMRACQVFNKLCEYTSEPKDAGRVLKREFIFRGTKFEKVNRCIAKYINKTGVFPDYLDVLDLIKSTNETEDLKLEPFQLERIAKQAFTEIGEQLQRLRKEDDADTMLCILQNDGGNDPADQDPELEHKLQENKKHWNKINEVIDKFAEKKVEEADEGSDSGDEDDDDDDDDDDGEGGDDKEGGDFLNSGSDANNTDGNESEDGESDNDTDAVSDEKIEGNGSAGEQHCEPAQSPEQEQSEEKNHDPAIGCSLNQSDENEKKEDNLAGDADSLEGKVAKSAQDDGEQLSKNHENTEPEHVSLDLSAECTASEYTDNVKKNDNISDEMRNCTSVGEDEHPQLPGCNIKKEADVDAIQHPENIKSVGNDELKVKLEEGLEYDRCRSPKIRVKSAQSLGGYDFQSPKGRSCIQPRVVCDVIELD